MLAAPKLMLPTICALNANATTKQPNLLLQQDNIVLMQPRLLQRLGKHKAHIL